MDDHQQLTKTSKPGHSLPSIASQAADDRARSIAALLNRLALHCPVRNLPESQAAMLMEDTIRDLMEYDPQTIALACDAWRRGPTPFFPTSGQLIALIKEKQEIGCSPWNKPTYRATKQIEGPRAVLKPYRQILAEKSRSLPPADAEQPPKKPAELEQLDAHGELSAERKAELLALATNLAARARHTTG